MDERTGASITAGALQEDDAKEALKRCVTCHAPLSTVQAGLEHPSRSEGVTCAVCHVREEGILASSAFCASCHELTIPLQQGGETVWTDEAQQSTWSEWSLWQSSGGTRSGQGCHVQDHGHAFPGAHDVALLRGAGHPLQRRSRSRPSNR